MDKSHLAAEWILARISSNDRASEIVGDLVEQQKGPAAFWFAILRIAFAMSWRWVLALPVAMLSALPPFMVYAHFVVGPHLQQIQAELERLHAHTPTGNQLVSAPVPMQIGGYILMSGICLGIVAVLALFRYGARNPLTGLSSLLAVLFTAAACTVWLPYAPVIAPLTLTVVVGLLLCRLSSRRALLCVTAAGLSFAGVFAAMASTASLVTNHLQTSQLVVWLDCSTLAIYMTCIVAAAWVLTRTQRVLLSSSKSPYA